MRILVCGGREYDDWKKLSRVLAEHNPSVIIQGGAPGADKLAHKWADCNNVPSIVFPANWKQGGKGGPIRNSFMLAECRADLVIAFPGGPGTVDMVRKAKGAGLTVKEIT